MILMAGRRRRRFTTFLYHHGAINDFEETLKLAEKMIVYYGMVATPFTKMSDKYKEMVDLEVATLIEDAYKMSSLIVKNTKDLILRVPIY
jgi:ATP-dependent Zn protease